MEKPAFGMLYLLHKESYEKNNCFAYTVPAIGAFYPMREKDDDV